jgi:hypothetical protein
MCRSDRYRGQWVALNAPRYHPATGEPVEGELVDADEDLAVLCARLRAADRSACAILFCETDEWLARVETHAPRHLAAMR